MAEAVHNALADAGIELGQVDGLMTGTSLHFLPTLSVAEYLGIRPTFIDGTMIGGASFVDHLIPAALGRGAGLCKAAPVCYGSTEKGEPPIMVPAMKVGRIPRYSATL